MLTFRRVAVLLLGSILLVGSIPAPVTSVIAASSARGRAEERKAARLSGSNAVLVRSRTSARDRAKARRALRQGVLSAPATQPTAPSSSSSSLSSSIPDAAKPRCKRASDVQWVCSACSTCTHNGKEWTQICKCYPDSNTCFMPGGGNQERVCTPTVEQQASFDFQQQQKLEEADLQSTATKQREYLASVQSDYNAMVALQTKMDSLLPKYTGSTAMQLFQLSTQYAEQVSLMKTYRDKAKGGTLRLAEMPVTTSILDAGNDIAERFLSIAKAAQSSNSTTTSSQSRPPTYTPSTSNHDLACQRERLRGGQLGLTSDSAWLHYYEQTLGCR